MDEHAIIKHNVAAHDRVAKSYENNHPEIFNPTEQARLKSEIKWAISQIKTNSKSIQCLDFGAGTGNLSKHLLDLGLSVCAADVSTGCLNEIKQKFINFKNLQTLVLNGKDLTGIKDDAYDLVIMYSVLHHIPDYLAVVSEFIRVLKPGGVVVIEHEVNQNFWSSDPNYHRYLSEISLDHLFNHYTVIGTAPTKFEKVKKMVRTATKVFNYSSWRAYLSHFSQNQPADSGQDEGDVHVTLEDHIDWEKIIQILKKDCQIIRGLDYLVCRETSSRAKAWQKWHEKTTDMKTLAARKK